MRLTASQTWAARSGTLTVGVDPAGGTPSIDLGAAGQVLTVRLANPGNRIGQALFDLRLTGAGGLTLTAAWADGATDPGAGFLRLSPPAGRPSTATGPLVVTGGTLGVGRGGWAGTSLRVTGGQLQPLDAQ